MTVSNNELLARAGASLEALGVKALEPTVPTTASLQTGDFMDRKQVERLVDLTVGQSGWLSAVSLRLRNQRSGEIPRVVINDIVTEGVPENGNRTVATHPDTDNVPYRCKKYQSTWYITREDVREAAASGEPDFDAKIRRAFAKAMGNDMARAALNGDEALDDSTRLNRLLRQRDGWLKKIRAGGNRATTTYGNSFETDLFFSMLANMPEVYRDDAELRWFMASLLDISWTQTLSDARPISGSMLADRATIERQRFQPLGIPQLLIPQMPTALGFSTLNGSAGNPDSVIDDGDGTLTAVIDAIFGGFSTDWVGRRVKITYTPTGESETLAVVNIASSLRVQTAGSLGQTTIDTTASNYTVDIADATPVILTNPLNLFMVLCDQVRAYRKFEQEAERWRIDVYWEGDFGVFNLDAVYLQDGVTTPRFSFGS